MSDLGCTNLVEHRIDLEPNAVPWREGARRLAPFKAEKAKEEIQHLLILDLIEPDHSPWDGYGQEEGQPIKILLQF